MRMFAIAVAVIALSACSPSAPSGADKSSGVAAAAKQAAAVVFPSLFSGAYRAEATIKRPGGGAETQAVIVRDGGKMRMEFVANGAQMVMISDRDANQQTMITSMAGQRMALRQPFDGSVFPEEAFRAAQAEGLVHVGPCAGAGETGEEWRRTREDGSTSGACVTSDGIILSASKNGEQVWRTTKIERGPQDPAQFVVPAGVQVINFHGAGSQNGR